MALQHSSLQLHSQLPLLSPQLPHLSRNKEGHFLDQWGEWVDGFSSVAHQVGTAEVHSTIKSFFKSPFASLGLELLVNIT